MEKTKKISIIPILCIVFLDMVGLSIVFPVLAPLFINQANGFFPLTVTLEQRAILLGFLLAMYPLAQLFGAPILGAISDRFGRKPVLVMSLAGTALGHLIFGVGVLTQSLPLLFGSRLLDGFTGANISTVYSAIADVSDRDRRTRNFGFVGMAFGLGFIFGPWLGGRLSDSTLVSWFNFATPFWFAAGLAIINLLLVHFRFRETLRERIRTSISLLTGVRNVVRAFKLPSLRTMFIVVFLFSFGFTFFSQFFQVFLIEQFRFTQSKIGDVFAYVGIWIAVVQGTLIAPVAKRYRPIQVLRVTILMLGLVFPLLLFVKNPFGLYFVMPLIALFNGLGQPNITSIISSLGDRSSQGELMGINQSVHSLAFALPPILAGWSIIFGAGTPIFLASGFILLSWLVLIIFYKPKPEQVFHET